MLLRTPSFLHTKVVGMYLLQERCVCYHCIRRMTKYLIVPAGVYHRICFSGSAPRFPVRWHQFQQYSVFLRSPL